MDDSKLEDNLTTKRNIHLESWTRSGVKKYCVEHNWSIDNLYTLFDHLKDSSFSDAAEVVDVTLPFYLESEHFYTTDYDMHLEFIPKLNTLPQWTLIKLIIVARKNKMYNNFKKITYHKLSIIDKDKEYFNVNGKIILFFFNLIYSFYNQNNKLIFINARITSRRSTI